MLRFVFKQHYVNMALNLEYENVHTLDTNIPLVEALLCRGGSGPDGFDHTTLVGVEVIKDAPQKGSGAPGNFAQQGPAQNGPSFEDGV